MHRQADPFLSYCLGLLSFRLSVAEDKGGSAMRNVLHRASNPTAGWLAETFESSRELATTALTVKEAYCACLFQQLALDTNPGHAPLSLSAE